MELSLLPIAMLVSVVAGALTARWAALAVPLILIPLFYLGLRYEWWGYGVGDGWQLVGAVFTLITVVVTAAAIALSRAGHRLRSSRRT